MKKEKTPRALRMEFKTIVRLLDKVKSPEIKAKFHQRLREISATLGNTRQH